MSSSNGIGKTAGLAGSVVCTAGVIAFFVGIFGGPRVLAFVGIGLMAFSLLAFYIEEYQARKA